MGRTSKKSALPMLIFCTLSARVNDKCYRYFLITVKLILSALVYAINFHIG